jgi:hypothetical protein
MCVSEITCVCVSIFPGALTFSDRSFRIYRISTCCSMLGCYNERDKNQLRIYKKTGPPDGGKEFRPAKPGNA